MTDAATNARPRLPLGPDQALEILAARGASLRSQLHFAWSDQAQHIAYRLRLPAHDPERPIFAALLGGASAGKSTVFNNLLGGHVASRIAARGHTTLGPVVAVPERLRPQVERWVEAGLLFPGFRAAPAELDDNVSGALGAFSVVYHDVEALKGVILVDLPDFTSEGARREGDIALSLLPWFDRILVVVDHERWFDRQSISWLRSESAALDQQRWAIFNRTRESPLAEADRRTLLQQAERLGAAGTTILEFRRGRGFLQFPPGTLGPIPDFLSADGHDRTTRLTTCLAGHAQRVLNQNAERRARVAALERVLSAAVERLTPSARECLTALMTVEERRNLEPIARVLRLHETSDWIAGQARRLRDAIGKVPLLGMVVGSTASGETDVPAVGRDRREVGLAYFEMVRRRQRHELRGLVVGSAFWDDMRRWTGLEPAEASVGDGASDRPAVGAAVATLDAAIVAWIDKVASECRGLAPNVKGAMGLGTIGLAIVLVAAPGPVTALTLISAKTAVGGAITQLLTAAGAGALFGRPMGRLMSIVQERLLGSAELTAVNQATAEVCSLIRRAARHDADAAVKEADALVLGLDDPLGAALEHFAEPVEPSESGA